jgi:DNA-binding transcriptional MerR regulator
MGDPEDQEKPEPLSIGEVLAVLTEEFPDVTVSKIRFLESQGLVNPDRNASGYRQFDDADIGRLRWILRQQRDKFLPLKVIKRALDSGVDVVEAGSEQPTLWTAVADDAVDRLAAEAAAEGAREEKRRARTDTAGRGRHSTPADVVAALQEDPRPAGSGGAPKEPAGAARTTARPAAAATDAPAGDASTGAAGPAREVAETARGGGGPAGAGSEGAAGDGAGSHGRDELLAATGITGETLDALEEFGLVAPSMVAGEPTYDDADLLVGRAASRCAELGLGPRHLRIYKVAAVREAGLVEQLVMPLVKQRNPEARAQAERTVAELTDLGARVHAALLARELGPLAP